MMLEKKQIVTLKNNKIEIVEGVCDTETREKMPQWHHTTLSDISCDWTVGYIAARSIYSIKYSTPFIAHTNIMRVSA